ncbi:MAG TPA: lysozyme inhibitor LprI family protein [Gemmatimonadaceae bacterium]|nr:lysozyme inhibitor LprI family protein [Gemmatimonadaceae bacterium]
MPTDFSDSPVDFSKLDGDYQILTELHRDGETPTYLARHIGLNRDVTISVVRAAGDRSYLEAFAADAKILAERRNPAIVPVIEGRWLDEHTFAIVRARVRGSTLDQLLSAIGSMPEPRVSSTLRQVAAALGWARVNGVKHRRVSPQSIVFQQGSGRVLLALEPWPNPSDDAATLRNLAARMTGGAPVDITEYLGLLAGGVIADEEVPVATVVEPRNATYPPVAPVAANDEQTVIVQERSGMGFNGRLMSAIVVLAAVIVLAAALIHRRDGDQSTVTKTSNGVLDSGNGEAAGESALHSNRTDTAVTQPPVNPVIIEPATPTQQAPQPMMQPVPAQVAPPPVAARPAPPPRPAAPVDTAAQPTNGDACSSPTSSDQHRCLMNSIAENDAPLNSVYQKLIAALRRQANVADDDPDPATVADLRSEQRRWLEDRDDACHTAGDGPLYARDRAACYADRSSQRTKDLQARLDNMSLRP